MNAVLALPIIAPLVGAALTIMFRHSILQRIISFTALSISLISAIIITVDVSRDTDIAVSRLGGWPANIGRATGFTFSAIRAGPLRCAVWLG